ncbi:MAG: phosphatase PAP2 family protein [Lapillicoccus sp.]
MSATTFVLTAGVGGVLTDGAREVGDLSTIDPSITSAALRARSSFVNTLALGVTSAGSTVGLTALTLLAALWLGLRQRQWRTSGLLVLVMVGAAVLTVALKTWVGRTRPPITDLISTPSTDPSFPSGHTLNSTVFFGMLVLIALRLGRETDHQAIRPFWLGVLTLIPVAVGMSRVYLGYHWATDVLGGWALGLACLASIVLLWTTWAYPRKDTSPESAADVMSSR